MRLDHPIFHTPIEAGVVLDTDHPYEDARDGQGTWLVHSGTFQEGCDVGMVSDGHGFEDSPDCERISGGVNSKGPRAVAIGRQGNLLQWGFYGAPDRMTDSAKKTFQNAIVYMRQFDGQRPLVKKLGRGRTWLEQHVEMLGQLAASDQSDSDQSAYLTYLKKPFPPELTEGDLDVGKLRAWYDANVEYFRSEGRGGTIQIDADLQALALSNRKPEFLEYLLTSLQKDPTDEKALVLAERYLPKEATESAASITAYIAENRPFLFFTDTGGYRWMVDENARRGQGAEGRRPKRAKGAGG